MLKEALEYLAGLGVDANAPQLTTVDDRTYVDKQLNSLRRPLDAAVTVSTLGGFLDLIKELKAGPDDFFIHVVNEKKVSLVKNACSEWGERLELAHAVAPALAEFPFGKWLDQEQFFIALQTQCAAFVDGTDLDYLLRIAANVTAEQVAESEDDGISQKVGLRKGVSLKTGEVLRPRVQLAPFRLFREAEQPVPSFIFRAKSITPGAPPNLALFEADGGKWKIQAVQNVKAFLVNAQTSLAIVA